LHNTPKTAIFAWPIIENLSDKRAHL